MKRIIFILIPVALLLAATGSAHADSNSKAVLAGVNAKLRSLGAYEVWFTVSGDGMDDVSGTYLVSGNKYNIKVADQEHFSDGAYRYEIYRQEREVVIDRIDPKNRSVLSDPTRAFEFADDEFDSLWKGRIAVSGKECDVVELKPRKEGQSGVVITLYVYSDTSLPAAVSYNYDGQEINISVDRLAAVSKTADSIFGFDRSRYEGWEIIDFR